MSLKHFHIAFIITCLLFTWGFGAWCLLMPGLPSMFAVMGWISIAGGAMLLIYGIRFITKAKKLSA